MKTFAMRDSDSEAGIRAHCGTLHYYTFPQKTSYANFVRTVSKPCYHTFHKACYVKSSNEARNEFNADA